MEHYFDAHIANFLFPMIIGKQYPFPFLTNKELYAKFGIPTIKRCLRRNPHVIALSLVVVAIIIIIFKKRKII